MSNKIVVPHTEPDVQPLSQVANLLQPSQEIYITSPDIAPLRQDEVIDLGAPRGLRTRPSADSGRARWYSSYTPNPRLYPGPQATSKPRVGKRTSSRRAGPAGAGAGWEWAPRPPPRRKRRAQRYVPNPRLYCPQPRTPRPPRPPPPPPACPCAAWSPPPRRSPSATASRAALRLAQHRVYPLRLAGPARARVFTSPARAAAADPARRAARRHPRRQPPARPHAVSALPPPARAHAVSALPPPLAPQSPSEPARSPSPHYRPRSQHFRLRSLDTDSGESSPVAARPRPPPAMAGPHPPLVPDAEDGSDGADPTAPSEYLAEFLSAIMRQQYAEALKYCRLILQYEPHNGTARGFYPLLLHKLGQAGAGGSSSPASSGSCASLSLDSPSPRSSRSASPAAPHSPAPPLNLMHTQGTLSSSSGSPGSPRWPGASSGSDDNGNPAIYPEDEDDENENPIGAGAGAGADRVAQQDAALQALRAQFACSIK